MSVCVSKPFHKCQMIWNTLYLFFFQPNYSELFEEIDQEVNGEKDGKIDRIEIRNFISTKRKEYL